MTDTIRELTGAEIDSVGGGTALPTLSVQATISLPHIPKNSELLTPAQIASLLQPPLGLPVTHG